jgi:hypothetical protein
MSRTGSNPLRMNLLNHYWCNGDLSPRGVRIPVPKRRPSLTRAGQEWVRSGILPVEDAGFSGGVGRGLCRKKRRNLREKQGAENGGGREEKR